MISDEPYAIYNADSFAILDASGSNLSKHEQPELLGATFLFLQYIRIVDLLHPEAIKSAAFNYGIGALTQQQTDPALHMVETRRRRRIPPRRHPGDPGGGLRDIVHQR
ncbi:MAG: hypothetical protein LBU32_29900 [Clostridiales bacterium]|nr:hypothetical protein [Clostridiales bacterium]